VEVVDEQEQPTRQDPQVDIWARSKWCLANAPRRVGYGHYHPYQELGVRGVYVEDKVYRVREWDSPIPAWETMVTAFG
jgi:hypothetical protein